MYETKIVFSHKSVPLLGFLWVSEWYNPPTQLPTQNLAIRIDPSLKRPSLSKSRKWIWKVDLDFQIQKVTESFLFPLSNISQMCPVLATPPILSLPLAETLSGLA